MTKRKLRGWFPLRGNGVKLEVIDRTGQLAIMTLPGSAFITMEEVARLFRVSRVAVGKWVRAGKLRGVPMTPRKKRKYIMVRVDDARRLAVKRGLTMGNA
jgi:hypothetical protein